MNTIDWKNVIGGDSCRDNLARAAAGNRLAHAYLFAGAAGTATLDTALQLSMSRFCSADNAPCFECSQCRRILDHAHPDFRYVFPVELTAKDRDSNRKINERGWRRINGLLQERLKNPYGMVSSYSSVIPVDWIREVIATVQRGPVESGRLAVVIEGIDTMKKESANALLKTLEEPPENTLIILICRSLDRVLPTIRSRCQIMRFGAVGSDEIRRAVQQRGYTAREDALQTALMRGNGAAGAVFAALEDSGGGEAALARELFTLLFSASSRSLTERTLRIEEIAREELGRDYSRAESVLTALLEEFRITFLSSHGTGSEYIFTAEGTRVDRFSLSDAEKTVQALEDALQSVRKHSPLLLVFSELDVRIMDITNE
ncbi:MAG: ATP-binding protein [Fibrobacterota bacterium]